MRLYRKNVGSVCALLAALLLSSSGIAQAPDAAELAAAVSAEEAAAFAWTDKELVKHLAGIDEEQTLEAVQAFTEEESKAVRLWVLSVEKYNRGEAKGTRLRPNFLVYAEAVSPDDDMENLIIRGTRSQGLGDVPIAVTQFTAADIQNLRIKDVADLAAYTPNLEINTAFAASNPTLFIRGIGLKDYNSNAAGAVAIWHDDVHMVSTASQLFSLFDVGNINVLRGPQGGLRGRNASGGKISIKSSEPDGDYEAWGSFTYGNFNNKEFEGAVAFPIFPDVFNDTLSGRLSFVLGLRDGYLNNTCADWTPTDHINPATGLPFFDVTRENQRAEYDALQPYAVSVVHLKSDGTPVSADTSGYVYENEPQWTSLLQRALAGGTNRVYYNHAEHSVHQKPGPGGIGLVDDPHFGVKQARGFSLNADFICLRGSPGSISTHRGIVIQKSTTIPKARYPEGTFRPRNRALALEDFAGLKQKLNDVDYMGARAMLRFQPTDSLDFLFTAHWGRNRSDSFHLQSVGVKARANPTKSEQIIDHGFGYTELNTSAGFDERNTGIEKLCDAYGIAPRADGDLDPNVQQGGKRGCDIYNGFYNLDGFENIDLLGFSLRTTWELETGRLRSITAYEESHRDTLDDGDDCPCGADAVSAEYIDDAWQVSQELLLSGEGENFTWMTGGYFMHDRLESANLSGSLRNLVGNQFYFQENTSWNVGIEGQYDFLEEGEIPGFYQLSVKAQTRYAWEHKVFALKSILETSNRTFSRLPMQTERKTWKGVTGEFNISWKPVESSTIYLKYTRGQKAGHFNAGLSGETSKTTSQSITPVKSEHIHAAELGMSTSFFDGVFSLNGAVFRYWYQNLQVFDIINEANTAPSQQLLSADANVMGMELEGQIRPHWWILEGLNLEGGFGWLDSEFVDFFVSKTTSPGDKNNPPLSGIFDYSGNPLIASPEWNWSGSVEYELPLGEWGFLTPRWDFSYKSQVYLDPAKEEAISQLPYWLHHLRLGYRSPDGRFEIAGWIQNLFRQEYQIDAFDLSRQFNLINQVWGEPRTYGITLNLSWP